MSLYSGQNGRMQLNGTTVAKVTSWSFSSSMQPLETTVLEDTDSTFIPGLRSATGSCTVLYYEQDGDNNDAKDLITKLVKERTADSNAGIAASPEEVTLSLQIVEGGTARSIDVTVLLTGASMRMAVGEVLSADVSFQVTGAPLEASTL